jgi:hypothetical protein
VPRYRQVQVSRGQVAWRQRTEPGIGSVADCSVGREERRSCGGTERVSSGVIGATEGIRAEFASGTGPNRERFAVFAGPGGGQQAAGGGTERVSSGVIGATEESGGGRLAAGGGTEHGSSWLSVVGTGHRQGALEARSMVAAGNDRAGLSGRRSVLAHTVG